MLAKNHALFAVAFFTAIALAVFSLSRLAAKNGGAEQVGGSASPANRDMQIDPNARVRGQSLAAVTTTRSAGAATSADVTFLPTERDIPNRKDRWFRLARAQNLDQAVEALLREQDVESASFALAIKSQCILANNEEYEMFQFATKAIVKQEVLAKAYQLRSDFLKRCGKLGEGNYLMTQFPSKMKENRANGGLLANVSSYQGTVEEMLSTKYDVLDKLLRDSTLATAWITRNNLYLRDYARNANFFSGLGKTESQAVLALTACELGADCADGSLQRLKVCMDYFFCEGSSVPESVALSIGTARMQAITGRANQLAMELVTNGARIFRPTSAIKK